MAAKRSSKGSVKVGGKWKFPLNTKGRARNALARINQGKGLSVGQKRTVVAKAYRVLGVPKSKRRVKISSSGRVTKKK